jgi:hypothetical protein
MSSATNNFELRQQAMREIMDMNDDIFLWKLLSDSLPSFPLATEEDSDYIHIMRDTNHTGAMYALVHKDRLRQMKTEDYVYSLFPESIVYRYDGEEVVQDYSRWNYRVHSNLYGI